MTGYVAHMKNIKYDTDNIDNKKLGVGYRQTAK
jgi:hypothetical protein